jgi:putative ABC transport system permease protein
MNSPMILLRRLRALFFKTKLEQELNDEISSHLQMQIDEYVSRGMNPREARDAALRRFGGVEQVKEQYRDKRGLPRSKPSSRTCATRRDSSEEIR